MPSEQSSGGIGPRFMLGMVLAALFAVLQAAMEPIFALIDGMLLFITAIPDGLVLPLTTLWLLSMVFGAMRLSSQAGMGPVIAPFEATADSLQSFFSDLSDPVVDVFVEPPGDTDSDPLESIHREYREGEITELELEKRIDAVLSEQEDIEPETEATRKSEAEDGVRYKFPCLKCGHQIEVEASLTGSQTGEIRCPECGDDSWRWDDATE